MWRENEGGDWYWPLHRDRLEDHLRVWRVWRSLDGLDQWIGALVLDGECLDPTRVGPCKTAEEAKERLFARASFYLGVIGGSIAEQLTTPGSFSLFNGSLVKLSALLSGPSADAAVKDTPEAQAWLKEVRGYLR